MNNTISESISFRDIFSTFREIFSTSKGNETNKEINEQLQNVLKIEKEIGATEAIAKAEKFVTTFISKISKGKTVEKVQTSQANLLQTDKENNIEQDNNKGFERED